MARGSFAIRAVAVGGGLVMTVTLTCLHASGRLRPRADGSGSLDRQLKNGHLTNEPQYPGPMALLRSDQSIYLRLQLVDVYTVDVQEQFVRLDQSRFLQQKNLPHLLNAVHSKPDARPKGALLIGTNRTYRLPGQEIR